MKWGFVREEQYDFAPDQRAAVPGSPARPDQEPWRRVVFFFVSLLLCLTSNLVNALAQVNASDLMGSFGVDSDQIAWLPVIYSMTFVSMNLLLVRFRQQFGLRPYAIIGLAASCTIMALHTVVRGFQGALMVHAAAGVAAAPMSSLAVYYMMTAMPRPLAVTGVVLALGLEQVSTPFARLIYKTFGDANLWQSIYLFEFGLTLLCLGCVGLFRLPPSERAARFQALDFVTFLFFAPGAALVCAVLGLGEAVWWPDQAWLGWALAVAIPLLGAALFIESRRAHPMLDLHWLSGPELIRFAVVAVVSRVVLTEQSSATSFLSLMGIGNEELQTFSLILVLCTLAGAVTAAVIFRPNRISEMVALVVFLVAIAAYHDSHSTGLTRAPQFYLSQGTVAFATAMFMGPALLFGVARVVKVGGGPLASFLVLFTATQNIGGLAGSALLSTFQVFREQANSTALTATVSATNPNTAGQIAAYAATLSSTVTDPGARASGGVAALQAQATLQSNILAYNNTFLLVAILAAATTAYLAVMLALLWWPRPAAPAGRPERSEPQGFPS